MQISLNTLVDMMRIFNSRLYSIIKICDSFNNLYIFQNISLEHYFHFSTMPPKTVEVEAFLDYIEPLELEAKVKIEEEIQNIKANFRLKKMKLKEIINQRFRDRHEKLQNKASMNKMKPHEIERQLRKKYLERAHDTKFKRDEWDDNK